MPLVCSDSKTSFNNKLNRLNYFVNNMNDNNLNKSNTLPDTEIIELTNKVNHELIDLEETLERLIKKIYSKKIERIIVDVVERAVTGEIEKLKNILLEEVANKK